MRKLLGWISIIWLCGGCTAKTDVIITPKPEYHIEEASEENVLESKIVCYADWFHDEETVSELTSMDFYRKFPGFIAFPENWQLDNTFFVNVIYQEQLGESYGLSYHDGEHQLSVSIRSINEPEVAALLKQKPSLLSQKNTIWKWYIDEDIHISFFKDGYYYMMQGIGIHDTEIIAILDAIVG